MCNFTCSYNFSFALSFLICALFHQNRTHVLLFWICPVQIGNWENMYKGDSSENSPVCPNDHSPENKNFCQGVCKFEIIAKWTVCCVGHWSRFWQFKWVPVQKTFDTKTWIYYWNGVFASCFGKNFFLS